MRPAGNEHLRSAERLGQALTLRGGDCTLQLDEVSGFLFFDVLFEVRHQRLDLRDEVRVGGMHILELCELFFDLAAVSDMIKDELADYACTV